MNDSNESQEKKEGQQPEEQQQTQHQEYWRLLYQIKINDIRYSKKHQWYAFYLTIIAIGGVITLFFGLKQFKLLIPDLAFQIFLTLISSLIGIIGICFIYHYNKQIEHYWDEKNHYITNFPPEIREYEEERIRLKINTTGENLFIYLYYTFYIIITLAVILSLMVIWFLDCWLRFVISILLII